MVNTEFDPIYKVAFSHIFKRNIMCVKYQSDINWHFVLIDENRQPCSKIFRAKSNFNQFIWK